MPNDPYSPASLDSYLAKVNERSKLLQQGAQDREAGVSKLKTESGYGDKQAALDTATKTLYETQKRLDMLPENVRQRTAGRPVTMAQLNRITSAESDPLTKQAQAMSMSRGQSQDALSRVDQAIKDYIGNFNTDLTTRSNALGGEADALFQTYQATEARNAEERERQFQREMAAIQKAQADQDRANALRIAQMSIPRYNTNTNTTPTTNNNNKNVDLSKLPDLTEKGQIDNGLFGLGTRDVDGDFALNPFSKQNQQVAKQYQDYVKKQNSQWYDYINPIKSIGNTFSFLGGAR